MNTTMYKKVFKSITSVRRERDELLKLKWWRKGKSRINWVFFLKVFNNFINAYIIGLMLSCSVMSDSLQPGGL